jgi:hypothetical protein
MSSRVKRAAPIREFIEVNFKVVMGRWRDMPVLARR